MYTQGVPARTRGSSLLRFAVAAMALVGLLVGGASRGAFSQPTGDDTSGGVVLTDDDAGAAMFSVAGLMPSATVVECIEITYDGTASPAVVSLYGSSGGTGLDAYLDLTIEEGTGGAYGDCSAFATTGTLFAGTLAELAARHADFDSGLQAWSPASSPESRSYRFSLTLQDDNGAQGLEVAPNFMWEVRDR